MTELEEAAMIVSISLCEGVEWVTELEEATRVFPYLCVKEWRSGVGDRARRGCYECFHIPV